MMHKRTDYTYDIYGETIWQIKTWKKVNKIPFSNLIKFKFWTENIEGQFRYGIIYLLGVRVHIRG